MVFPKLQEYKAADEDAPLRQEIADKIAQLSKKKDAHTVFVHKTGVEYRKSRCR